MKISIIVPVYNVEAYLHECVDSILNQSYQNLEVILVDDGSPDSCPQICDEYAIKDTRVKVIHKENGGLSDARNVGIATSTGDYVLCIDSDDYWGDKEGIASLIDVVDKHDGKVDIVMFGRTVHYEDNNKVSIWPSLDLERINGRGKIEVLTYLTEIGNLYTSACNKMILRSLLVNGVEFKKGLLSEDLDWSLQVYLKANRFYAVNNPFYQYRKRSGSITTTMKEKNFRDLLYIISKWTEKLPSIEMPDEERNIYLGFLCYQYCILMGLLSRADKSIREAIQKEMKQYEWLLKYDCNYKTHLVCTLYKTIGFNLTVKILSVYLAQNVQAKRILLIINKLRGGGEALFVEFSKGQMKNCVVVVVLLPKTDNILSEKCPKNGISVIELEAGSLYSPFCKLKLYKLMPLFDTIHISLFQSLYWITMTKRISCNRQKIFFTEYGNHNRRRNIRMLRMTDQLVYSIYNPIIDFSNPTIKA